MTNDWRWSLDFWFLYSSSSETLAIGLHDPSFSMFTEDQMTWFTLVLCAFTEFASAIHFWDCFFCTVTMSPEWIKDVGLMRHDPDCHP